MSATTNARDVPRTTARVKTSISSIVTGTVDAPPSTVVPAESPTSTTSTPAASASRALGASYAVTIAMRSPRVRMARRPGSVMTSGMMRRLETGQRRLVERDVVDEARAAGARGDDERRRAREVRDADVLD